MSEAELDALVAEADRIVDPIVFDFISQLEMAKSTHADRLAREPELADALDFVLTYVKAKRDGLIAHKIQEVVGDPDLLNDRAWKVDPRVREAYDARFAMVLAAGIVSEEIPHGNA